MKNTITIGTKTIKTEILFISDSDLHKLNKKIVSVFFNHDNLNCQIDLFRDQIKACLKQCDIEVKEFNFISFEKPLFETGFEYVKTFLIKV